MIWGAFMSGMDGGAANTFPLLMDGRLFLPGALSMVPVWLNLFEKNGLRSGCTAFAIVTAAVPWAWWRDRQVRSAALNLLASFALLQFGLWT